MGAKRIPHKHFVYGPVLYMLVNQREILSMSLTSLKQSSLQSDDQ